MICRPKENCQPSGRRESESNLNCDVFANANSVVVADANSVVGGPRTGGRGTRALAGATMQIEGGVAIAGSGRFAKYRRGAFGSPLFCAVTAPEFIRTPSTARPNFAAH